MTLDSEIAELSAVYTGLSKLQSDGCETVLSGTLSFEAVPDEEVYDGLAPITESFEIQIKIPDTYPDELPAVKETGGKIDGDYEHTFQEGALCLAVPVEMRRIFSGQPTLLGFVNNLVVPYFYGYCHWEKHGEHPFGEQKHHGAGILQYYVDRLSLSDEATALAFLCSLYEYEYGYRGHHICPCGSGRIVRKCHGPALRGIRRHHTSATLYAETSHALDYCFRQHESGKFPFQGSLLKQIRRILKMIKRRHSEHMSLLVSR